MTAVDHLCLGIPRGECFGLLGINGKRNVVMFSLVVACSFLSCQSGS